MLTTKVNDLPTVRIL